MGLGSFFTLMSATLFIKLISFAMTGNANHDVGNAVVGVFFGIVVLVVPQASSSCLWLGLSATFGVGVEMNNRMRERGCLVHVQ